MVMLLGFTLPAAAATWTTETVPAGPGALGPARLSFDAQPRAVPLGRGTGSVAAPLHRHGRTRARRRLDAPGEPARRGLG
jgi:hypothetical protein